MNISVAIFVAIVVWGILTVAAVALPFSPVIVAVVAGAVAGFIVH